MTLLLAAAVGLLLGAALGVFGGGGGILAVPLLVGLLHMDVDQAATASLVIVLFGAIGGLVSHHRAGRVLWRQGVLFGATSIVGTAVGTLLAARVADWVKLGAFTILMVVAGLAMLRNARRQPATRTAPRPSLVGAGPQASDAGAFLVDVPAADLPTSPRPVAAPADGLPSPGSSSSYSVPLLVLLATGTGLVTGFLGVGGGFLVVPALVLSLRMPMANATATGLVVIAMASTTSLLVRLTHPAAVGQLVVMAVLVLAAVTSSLVAARFSGRLSPRALGTGFALLVLTLSVLVATPAWRALASS
ncbi:MAG TPA: sulfite exporter TauE/SafE family protein [Candidatus Nanopelagicales bacterium]